MNKKIKEIKPKIVKLLKKHDITRAGIFGSYAMGDEKKDSDIDILIDIQGRKFSILDLISLEMELQKILNKKVDLLTYNGLNPLLKDIILKEEIKII